MSVVPLVRDETRNRILQAALELMAERGFAATSTREVSERLGFTKAALYYHFRTKDDLLAALVAPAIERLEMLVAQADPRSTPAARRDLLRGFIDLVATHEDLIRVLLQDPSVVDRPAIVACKPIFRRMTELLAGVADPGTVQRTRVLAALGGIQMALLQAEPDDDPAIVRDAVLIAACGALGIAAPRRVASR